MKAGKLLVRNFDARIPKIEIRPRGARSNIVVFSKMHDELIETNEIQSIDDSAFSETSIRSFLIPKGCKEIDKNAFKRCKKLQMIELEENSCCFSNVKQTPEK